MKLKIKNKTRFFHVTSKNIRHLGKLCFWTLRRLLLWGLTNDTANDTDDVWKANRMGSQIRDVQVSKDWCLVNFGSLGS